MNHYLPEEEKQDDDDNEYLLAEKEGHNSCLQQVKDNLKKKGLIQ